MQIARLVSPDGGIVLTRVEGDIATPLAPCSDRLGSDKLRDMLVDGIDLVDTAAIGPAFVVEGSVWRSPVQTPGKIIAVGLNYVDHAREANLDLPSRPMIFAKYATSIIGHREPIRFREADSAQVDYESELGVVIACRTRNISTERALQSVFGYTLCNDVSARDAQFGDGQFTRGKSFDTFCPIGPHIVTADEIEDPQRLTIRARVNGTTVQDSSTSEMIFSVAEIISYLSRFMTLEPGDFIATGTPAGVGMAKKPPRYLRDGDLVEMELEGVGMLTNPVEVV